MRITVRLIIGVLVSLYAVGCTLIFLKLQWQQTKLRKDNSLLLDDGGEEEETFESDTKNNHFIDSDTKNSNFMDSDTKNNHFIDTDSKNSHFTDRYNKQLITFKQVGGIYVFSVYLDNRPSIKPVIRIISLKQYNSTEKLGCMFRYESFWKRVYAVEYEMCENHGRIYGGWMYFCHVPEQLDLEISSLTLEVFSTFNEDITVSINITSNTHFPNGVTTEISLCVPPLFGDINLSMLLQFLELGKLQGINHFTFYLYQVKDSIRKILNYYQEQGEVTTVDWILPSNISPREIWYNGQMLAIQDCLYRNMAKIKYLGFFDFDEFIIPVEYFKLTDMIKNVEKIVKLSNISAFSFQSAFFDPKQLPDPSQQLKVLQLLKRNSKLSKLRTKLLTIPKNVLELGVHHVSKGIHDSTQVISVNPDIAKIHHYRACIMNFEPDMTCHQDIQDDTILKYSEKLIYNYKEALKRTVHLFVPVNKLKP